MYLSTGRLVNGSPCDRIDMVIKDLDLEPKIDDMMSLSRWKELSKEISGDGSRGETLKPIASLMLIRILGPKSVERASVLHQPDGVRSKGAKSFPLGTSMNPGRNGVAIFLTPSSSLGFFRSSNLTADPDAVSMIQTVSHLSPDMVENIQTVSLEPGEVKDGALPSVLVVAWNTQEENVVQSSTNLTASKSRPGVSFASLLKDKSKHKGLNFYTLITQSKNKADVAVPLESICVVFGLIQEECPKNPGLGVAKNVKKPSQTSRGVLVGSKVGFKPVKEYRLVFKKPTANSGDNDMACSMVTYTVGFGTKSLLEQWTDSYVNGDYDEDPYDDDMYEGQDLPNKLQDICDNLYIRVL
nr:hypothetical protein [Tanacetum cinerariifolium]